MLDFLLKNHLEFLEKFRKYSKEADNYEKDVEDFIAIKNLEINPMSDRLEATYCFDTSRNGDDIEVTFSDNLNLILAKNKIPKEDLTSGANIYIYNIGGLTKMNCNIAYFDGNPSPLDFNLQGVGAVEHFFRNEEDSKIHELKFGTWRFLSEEEQVYHDKILNLFPAILKEDAPSIKIIFSQEKENISVNFQFDSGESFKDQVNICFQIDRNKSEFLISANQNPVEMKTYVTKNIKVATQQLVNDCISEWLSKSVNLKKILLDADSDEIKVICELPTSNPKIHPTLEDLHKIEKSGEGESRQASRPLRNGGGIPNPITGNPKIESNSKKTPWIKL